MHTSRVSIPIIVIALLALTPACDSSGTGGKTAGTGGKATGGSAAGGGMESSVGASTATGGSSSGGTSSGGSSTTGGSSSGGTTSGGNTSTGGTKNTGGSAALGGSTTSGGGGSTVSGGTLASTGGRASSATSNSGGTGDAGGSANTGGTSASGGSKSTAATSGGTATGGSKSSGGTSGTGTSTANANDLWLAPKGSDSASGTESDPLATLTGAQSKWSAGKTIWLKPGTYAWSTTQKLSKAGSAASPINVFAAPGERPVIDFSGQPRNDSSARGIQISGSYWHLKGFDVMKAGDNCIHISGSNNTIEWIAVHGCCDSGLQITDANASNNTVLNCDSYENFDSQNGGENADGFAAKLELGPGNVFRGCRSWNNSDDGWDLFAAPSVVVIENCWAFLNGKLVSGGGTSNGDGNGFKLGGAGGGAAHKVSNCFSMENNACGYTRNNNTEVPVLSQCGGRSDGKGEYCSLTNPSPVSFSMTAAQAKAVQRNPDGSLPAIK
jgi:hypothetical protein